MKAWVMDDFGAPEVLRLQDLPEPTPGVGEVVVRVKAIAVARTKDITMRAGLPPFAHRVVLPHVPGTEHAGIVESVGPEVDPGLVGSRVAVSAVLTCGTCVACRRDRGEACESFALIGVDRQGCYAELVAVPAANIYAIPDDLSFAHAAALAANGPVARAQLEAGIVGPGSILAVMGAAGALGSTATCLGRYRGATVIAVDRLDDKGKQLAELPVDAMFDGMSPTLAQQLKDHTDGWGVDCVVDNLGIPSLWLGYRAAVAPMGRIIVSGAIGRDTIEMELLPFYLHSQALIGVRTGNVTQIRALWDEVRGGLRLAEAAVVTRPWTEMHDAHASVEDGRSVGQTVLVVP